MHTMCHEAINVSPAESGATFNELDHLPLTTRRSLLQSNSVSVPAIVKREEDCFNELVVVSNCDAPESVNSQTPESTSIGCSQGLIDSGNLRPQNNILVSCSSNAQMEETAGSGDDTLEHLSLKERRKLLLQRVVLRLPEPSLEDDTTKDCNETDLFKIKAENSCKNGIASSSEARFSGFLEKIDSFLYKKVTIGSKSGIQENDDPVAHEKSFELASPRELPSIDYERSPLSSNCYAAAAADNQRDRVKRVKRNPRPLNVSEIQSNQEKCESLDDCVMGNVVNSEQVQVKREVETHDDEEDEQEFVNLISRLTRCASAPSPPASFVKNETDTTASELDEDEIDHMKLIDRLNLRSSHGSCHHEAPPPSSSPPSGFSFCASDEYVKPLRVSRPWKRKKTATNSIETALEEDAPGLLQVLIKQGVTVDELRLYGEDDSSDDSLIEETFSELEDVISQLYFKRATGTKLLNLSFSKDSRSSYCLTCLFSLIEQARYLRFRKWPVEWGWCRDLQSFIFVFERHNRIVMERPEYGYATYFFELSNTASVGWQIKRLVLAMKLASCGRYQLIENKPLLVGEDMTEAEAEILMKFGWVANTGLGTMLNYRDRVFHDRKSHKESSEWKSKISKLLVDGYNSGTIVETFIAHPDDVEDDGDDDGLDMEDVKLETY